MDETLIVEIPPPRFEDGPAFTVAGLRATYTFETNQGIPAQWQRFAPYIGHIDGQVGFRTYGLCVPSESEGCFDYICGVEVAGDADLPEGFSRVQIEPCRYIVFTHRGHLSGIRNTTYTIWNKTLPDMGLSVLDAPNFELYLEDFSPETGGVEIWLPVG
jgi:AraC family transcriptional regulator